MEDELEIKNIRLLECINSNKPTSEKLIELRKCLEQRADVNIKDAEGNSPLHLAVLYERTILIKFLIKRGADVNGQDYYRKTPLHLAASYRETSIVKLLLMNGSKLNAQDAYGNTPLHCAIEYENEAVVEFLLSEGADLNAQTINGKYAIHVAAKLGSIFMMELLLNKGADVNVKDQYGLTTLHEAASSGEPSAVELLLDKGIDINVKDMFNCTPLHSAAGAGKMTVVKLLLNKGSVVNAQAVNGNSPLHEAAASGNITVVELLLDEGAEVNPQTPNGATPLLRALKARNILIAKLLINKGANVNAQIISLDFAALPSLESFTTLNFQERTALGCGFKYEDTALHKAVDTGDVFIVKLLLSKGANMNAQTSYGETPLHRAVRSKNEAVVILLLKKGAKVDVYDNNRKTPLHDLVRSGYITSIKLILNKGADVNAQTIIGDTPLHLLLNEIFIESMTQQVLHKIVIVQVRDSSTSTLAEKNIILKLLLAKGANVNLETKNGYNSLHMAAEYGQTSNVELLLNKNANVNATTAKGCTPLHLAAKLGHASIVQLLLDKNADLNLKDKFGNTPLHNAVRFRRDDIVALLLRNGADVNIRNDENKTPLILAAEFGWTSILAQLSKLVDVTALETNEDTPLHGAARFGMTSTMKQLLNKSADVNVKNSHGETPLHVAVRRNHIALVTQLVRRNANVLVENNKGDTPFSYAVYFSVDEKIVRLLQTVEKEAKLSIRLNNDQRQNPQDDLSCYNLGIFFNNGQTEEIKYSKSSNTSSHGQLYEIKMVSLVLVRTLKHEHLEHDFYLGTNIDGIGAMDDICLRYRVRQQRKPVVVFMQLKHREDPNERKLTDGALWNDSGDFSLKKYFESYLMIKERFRIGNKDFMFEGEFRDIECYFVLYTSAKENFRKKKAESKPNRIMHELISTHDVEPFQYSYNEADVNRLAEVVIAAQNENFAEIALPNNNSKECYGKASAKDFLNSLWFYSCQAKQEEVECIIKYEIDKHYNNNKYTFQKRFEFHTNAIFLRADRFIKKWWMLRGKAPYLTRSNDIFELGKLASYAKDFAIVRDFANKLNVSVSVLFHRSLSPNDFCHTPKVHTLLYRLFNFFATKHKLIPDEIDINNEIFNQSIAINESVRKTAPNNKSGINTRVPNMEFQTEFFEYLKRNGTSEAGGDFFRTKMLELVILRLMHHKQIVSPILGSELRGISALNDIILRFQVKEKQRPVILFMQLIHREDPEKSKLYDDALWSNSSDFSLLKYLKNYLTIRELFRADNEIPMFKANFCDVDCYFVLYTSVKENFTKKTTENKLNRMVHDLVSTGYNVEPFQFSHNVINCLTKEMVAERIEKLGYVFLKSIMSEKYLQCVRNWISKRSEEQLPQLWTEDLIKKSGTRWKPNILTDNLIAKYHVLMGKEILQPCKVQVNKEYRMWEFRPEFFNSNHDYLITFKKSFVKIISSNYHDGHTTTAECQSSVEHDYRQLFEPFEIALPLTFGNLDMTFRGSKDKVQKRMRALAEKIIYLLQLNQCTKMIEINENDVGPGKIIEQGFIDINGGIGGAVGNLLVLDIESDALKFNLKHETLPYNAALFLEEMKDERHKPFNENLSDFKFKFNVENFPKLSMRVDHNDIAQTTEFLSKFWFYPNQAKGDEIDSIINEEMYKKYPNTIPNSVFDFKLFFSGVIQKWWMQTKESPYITRESGLFESTELADILDRLQSVINFMFILGIDAIDISVKRVEKRNISEKVHELFEKLVVNLFHLFDPKFDNNFKLSRRHYNITDESTLSLKIDPEMEWVALTVTLIKRSKFKNNDIKRCFVAKAGPSRGSSQANERFMLYDLYLCGRLYKFRDCFRDTDMDFFIR